MNFLQVIELESPDLVVSRHNIATGKSPIATRESYVRYQMACKEDDYTYSKVLRFVAKLLVLMHDLEVNSNDKSSMYSFDI